MTSLKEPLFHLIQALQLFKRYAALNIFSAGVKFIAIATIGAIGLLSLSSLIWIEMLALWFCLGAQLIALPGVYRFHRLVNWRALSSALRFGFPLYLNNILTFVYERANTFIIGILLDPISIAYYEVAKKIPERLQRLFHAFIVVYFPNLSQLYSEKR